MPLQSRKLLFTQTLIAILAWAGLIIQLYVLLKNAPANGQTMLQATWRFFGFFTILTNLIIAVSLSAMIFSPQSRLARFFTTFSVTTAIALYILLVGLSYNILLRQLWQPQGLQRVADELLHVIVPLAYVLYWIFIVKKEKLEWESLIYWLIYPFLYLCYALLRGSVENWYPYYFIDVSKIGYASTFRNSLGLLLVLLAIGSLFIVAARNSIEKNN